MNTRCPQGSSVILCWAPALSFVFFFFRLFHFLGPREEKKIYPVAQTMFKKESQEPQSNPY